jgi:predicted transcriptional regulator
VKRDAEGYYELTPLGKSILAIFPSIRFLLKHRDYFLAHDLSYLPQDYTERIGELSSGEYVNHVSLVLELIKAVISKARKYVLLVSDQPIVVGNVGSSFYTRDIPVRLLGEQNIDRNIVAGIKSALSRAEVATVEQIRVAMAINENLAGVCFPGIGGKIDFAAGFSGSDPRFLTWCKDLFEFYWNKSRKI